MYQLLYYVYYGFTGLLFAALVWSILRKPMDGDELRKKIPFEKATAALVFIPLLLRLLGIK